MLQGPTFLALDQKHENSLLEPHLVQIRFNVPRLKQHLSPRCKSGYHHSTLPDRRKLGLTPYSAIDTFSKLSRAKVHCTMTRFLPLTLVLSAATLLGVWSVSGPARVAGVAALSASAADTEAASFGMCHSGGGTNCVVDGDTIWYRGTKIRIADIDTPETHQSRCAAEAERGAAATQRLYELVNAGPFTLQSIDRDEDRYGRKLRILTRGGTSLGDILVEEGLARYYEGGRRSWC